MRKSAMVRARIEPKLKTQAESILHRVGLNPTQAITIFYKQVELHQGLPFGVLIPTTTTTRTFDSTDAGRDLTICKDTPDLFKKLGI